LGLGLNFNPPACARIQVWRTGKGVLEILKDLKGLFSRKKRREKKKEENQKT
jgi:hypothetical protein